MSSTVPLTLALLLVLASEGPAAAQRARLVPPEPSGVPLIDAAAVQGLEAAVAGYQRAVSAGGWPILPAKLRLKLGDVDDNVALLRQRLQWTGDLGTASGSSSTFDEDLEAAVKRYQTRNGLAPNGIVYGITQRSLSVPADTRLRQLALNLARMRELLPRLSGVERYLLMNAASFELQGIDAGRVAVVSRVISGKRGTPTPVVSATVQAINLLPYWHVPSSIAKAQVIPTVRKDPTYLLKERIRVFSTFGGEEIDPALVNWWGPEAERYVFRQDPGPQNALGVLRFDMPNKHIVYMHDTPMKKLFDDFERAYSSGCVRTQRFLDVADWVLAGQDGWDRPTMEAVIGEGRAKTIKVARPVPVHFIYLTAWVDNGVVNFRNDLYNRDDSAFDGGEDVVARTLTPQLSP